MQSAQLFAGAARHDRVRPARHQLGLPIAPLGPKVFHCKPAARAIDMEQSWHEIRHQAPRILDPVLFHTVAGHIGPPVIPDAEPFE